MNAKDLLFYQAYAGETSGSSEPSVTVEPLEVTENGEYTAPEGTAYSPVTVNVPTGGGGGASEDDDVLFIDYDGTILYSYSAEDFLALTEMPANPEHDGLVAQGWNWSLADAQEYVEKYGMLDIGQYYLTQSGDTEIDIKLTEGRLSPVLGLGINRGEVQVDWGDGTPVTTVNASSSTSYTTITYSPHTYEAPGTYTIKLHIVYGSMSINGKSSHRSTLLTNGTPSATNATAAYEGAITAVRVGNAVASIGQYGLAYCRALRYVASPYSCQYQAHAFDECFEIRHVTIPEGSEDNNFSVGIRCHELKSISFPKTMGSFSNVCNYSESLRRVCFPEGITYVPANAFQNCTALRKVVIPNSVADIRSYAFCSCKSLAEVNIPSLVTALKSNVFAYCESLVEFSIPDTIRTIEDNAFNQCTGLRRVSIPDTITSMTGNSIFGSCVTLEEGILPDGLTAIGESMFGYCTAIRRIKLPSGITSIPSSFAVSCSELTSMDIPASVTSIGGNAFQSARSMGVLRFRPQTPPTLGSYVFSDLAPDCIIEVPAGTLAAYTSAANYPDPATYTYREFTE